MVTEEGFPELGRRETTVGVADLRADPGGDRLARCHTPAGWCSWHYRFLGQLTPVWMSYFRQQLDATQ